MFSDIKVLKVYSWLLKLNFMFMSVPHGCGYPRRPEEGVRCHETGALGS